MIMANLADVINDMHTIGYKATDELKAFMVKYQISPWDLEVKLADTGDVYFVLRVR